MIKIKMIKIKKGVVDTEDKSTKKRIMEFLKEGNKSGEVQSECDIGDDGRIISRLPRGYWSVVLMYPKRKPRHWFGWWYSPKS